MSILFSEDRGNSNSEKRPLVTTKIKANVLLSFLPDSIVLIQSDRILMKFRTDAFDRHCHNILIITTK